MTEICEKHKKEMKEVKTEIPEVEDGEIKYDELGFPIMIHDVVSICPLCEEEKLQEEDREFYAEPSYYEGANIVKERIREIERRNPHQKTLRESLGRPNFIDTYAPIISKITDAPFEACYAMSQFLVSCSLLNVKYENSKGKILPNLSIIWIAPSGSNKTPLIENTIEKVLPRVFPEFATFGVVTGKGFRKEVSRWKKDEIPIRPLIIVWDEMSTMAKDVKNDGTSDLYEVLSQAYDGKLTQYTSVRGGHEKYPHLYSNLWISGVPSFLENTDKSFWYQGFGLRSLFLKYDVVEPRDINDDSLDEIKTIYKDMEIDLSRMKSISLVKTTPEFMQMYNDYRKLVVKSIQDVQRNILGAEDPDIFPTISKVKFPVLVMKLAMINSASRWNFTEDGILILEVEDFERAVKDLESYHDNLVNMFGVWQELVETRSRIDNIKNLKDKIKRHIVTILGSGRGFNLTESKEDGELSFRAIPEPNGTWVSHASLLKVSHLTSRNFSEIIQTLIEQMMIAKREGFIEKNGLKYPVTFYCLVSSPSVP